MQPCTLVTLECLIAHAWNESHTPAHVWTRAVYEFTTFGAAAEQF